MASTSKKILHYVSKQDLVALEQALKLLKTDQIRELVQASSQDTVLHLGVRSGNLEIVKLLLNNGCEILLRHQNIDGKVPLHEAAQVNSLEILNALLAAGAEIDPLKRGDWTPLMLATAKANIQLVKKLVLEGASLDLTNKDGWSPFHIGCRTGDVSIVKFILSVKDDAWDTKSHNGRTPLHTACLHGNFAVMRYLLELRCYDISCTDACGNTPFMESVRSGKTDCVNLFFSMENSSHFCTTMDNLGRLPIHLAAEAGHNDVLALLVNKHGSNLDSLSLQGETPLHFAAKEGHTATLAQLVSLGASLNIQNKMNRTALWFAASSFKRNAYQLLLNSGSLDMPDQNGIFPSSLIKRKMKNS